jgi:hypothetical protein
MDNLLLATTTALSFPLALVTARFTLGMLFRAMRVRTQSDGR